MTEPRFEIVVPTIGRPSLAALLEALGAGPPPGRIFLVDDRPRPAGPLLLSPAPSALRSRLVVLGGRAAGPAAARNLGWRACASPWVVFVDDDVVPDLGWLEQLDGDLRCLPADVAGSQGRLRVPLPPRRPTDWERNVRGLERARWATADMAYRRDVLERLGGFHERFRRAYREDADLGLRVVAAGYRIARGRRSVTHPVRLAGPWISVRLQAGNADDVLMRSRHGRDWMNRAGVPRGRRRRHLAITAATALAGASVATGHRTLAAVGAGASLAGIAELAWARIAPGPRTPREVLTMILTSAVLPHAATVHWVCGWLRLGDRRRAATGPAVPRAALLDRDGTLVVDVPDNGDPGHVTPVAGARAAVQRLRAAGLRLAVVTNQSGLARGLLRPEQVEAVNRRIEELLGPLGPWFICPHGPDHGCGCRKPAPGLIVRAASALGLRPEDCVVIGDTGADVEAARAAGARGLLVPTAVTRREEVAAAPEVVPDLATAVDVVLGGRRS